jgi:predicted amino acid racemase
LKGIPYYFARLKKKIGFKYDFRFYAGALIAIDSARILGFPIDVEIYDPVKLNSSDVAAIIQNKNLENANAIGPFYQSAEIAARLLSVNNVPVISPLKISETIYQTIPTNEAIKNAMFDYMRSKSGNIIAVVDKKKESVHTNNTKRMYGLWLSKKKMSSAESLKSMLVKGRMNYVVMETGIPDDKTTIATMLSSASAYQVQLVILSNETLDTDEINFESCEIKLMYPRYQ